jgi:Zn-dependent protease/CBS domain-containing protein
MRATSASEGQKDVPRQEAVSEAAAAQPASRGLRLGKIGGIEIRLDWSLILVFVLIATNLGAGLFPRQHPDWGLPLTWTTAILAGVLFFASVLAHELAHAIVGRRHGVPIDRITLFIFGGMAEMKAEPKSPRAEFAMAIVGPLTSLVIGVAALLLGYALVRVPVSAADDPRMFARTLSAPATLLFWLGPVNILLAIFNLLPGFPLDGGRVLRAILWRATGDMDRATRWSSTVGRLLAFALMFVGVLMIFGRTFPLLGGGVAQGLWLLFIGWFLHVAALSSYQQVALRRMFQGMPVSRLVRSGSPPIDASASLQEAADRFLESADRCLPVVDQDRFVGLICLSDLARVPRSMWAVRPVATAMTPMNMLATTSPSEDVAEAFGKLAGREVDQLPVVEDGQVRGFLRRGDVLRWLELQRAGSRLGDAAPT